MLSASRPTVIYRKAIAENFSGVDLSAMKYLDDNKVPKARVHPPMMKLVISCCRKIIFLRSGVFFFFLVSPPQVYSKITQKRYRDVSTEVRSAALSGLRKIMLALPEVYVQDKLMRYHGWSLNDKVPSVRVLALQVRWCPRRLLPLTDDAWQAWWWWVHAHVYVYHTLGVRVAGGYHTQQAYDLCSVHGGVNALGTVPRSAGLVLTETLGENLGGKCQ